MKTHTKTLSALAGLALLTGSAHAATVGFEFETASNIEGWTAINQVNSLTQSTAVGGTEGVLNVDASGGDPFVGAPAVSLTAGETWSSLDIRFRQLNSNGDASEAYSLSGTFLTLPGANLFNFGIPAFGGVGDSEITTSVTSDGGDWQILTLDFTSAPSFNTLSSLQIQRFDGNDGNFEVDYARFTSIPEPGSLALMGLGGLCVLRRRRG